MEHHSHVAGIVYKKICTEYGLEFPGSKWKKPPKLIEKDQAKIMRDFQIQTDKMAVANQLDIVVINKQDKKTVVVDVTIKNDSNIRETEHEKLEKYQGLKEELERMCGSKGISGTPGDRSTHGCNPQAGRDHQSPRHLVEDQSLKGLPQGALGEYSDR